MCIFWQFILEPDHLDRCDREFQPRLLHSLVFSAPLSREHRSLKKKESIERFAFHRRGERHKREGRLIN